MRRTEWSITSDDSALIVTKYKVTAPGEAEITNSMRTLAIADYNLTRIIDKGEIIQSDFSFRSSFYPPGYVVPIYIEVEDGIRLARALKRERKIGNHRYEEMCRRFLADQKDFSEEKLNSAGIVRRFKNEDNREDCLREITAYISTIQTGGDAGKGETGNGSI